MGVNTVEQVGVNSGNEATHSNVRDGEGLGMRLHTHTLETVKAWD